MSGTERSVSWGHWGIIFWAGGRNARPRAVAWLPFEVGSQGPIDGTRGSSTRESYKRACVAWRDRAELPDGAQCPIEQAWLYDHDNPRPQAEWIDGRWVSYRRVGRNWVLDTA